MSIERTYYDELEKADKLFYRRKSPECIERKLRIETYSPGDIRALPPYLSVQHCNEIKSACDRWLASRGKLTGKNYANQINKTHNDL